MQAHSSSSQPESSSSFAPDNSRLSFDDFIQTGRTGRRNAVPDILTDKSSKVSAADLPAELEKLTCFENGDPQSSQ